MKFQIYDTEYTVTRLSLSTEYQTYLTPGNKFYEIKTKRQCWDSQAAKVLISTKRGLQLYTHFSSNLDIIMAAIVARLTRRRRQREFNSSDYETSKVGAVQTGRRQTKYSV